MGIDSWLIWDKDSFGDRLAFNIFGMRRIVSISMGYLIFYVL